MRATINYISPKRKQLQNQKGTFRKRHHQQDNGNADIHTHMNDCVLREEIQAVGKAGLNRK